MGLPFITRHQQPSAKERPLGIITGTGVVKGTLATLAYSFLGGGGDTRVFAIHRQGLGPLETGYQGTADEVHAWAQAQAAKVVLLGHSQGALHAVRFAMDHPELVEEVQLWCGPLDGTVLLDFLPPPLRALLGNVAPAFDDMAPGSQYLGWLHDRVAAEWPATVRVRMITAGGDILVRPRRSALTAFFPASADTCFYYLGPLRPRHLPDGVRHVWAPLAGHITVMVHPAARGIIRLGRRGHELAQAA